MINVVRNLATDIAAHPVPATCPLQTIQLRSSPSFTCCCTSTAVNLRICAPSNSCEHKQRLWPGHARPGSSCIVRRRASVERLQPTGRMLILTVCALPNAADKHVACVREKLSLFVQAQRQLHVALHIRCVYVLSGKGCAYRWPAGEIELKRKHKLHQKRREKSRAERRANSFAFSFCISQSQLNSHTTGAKLTTVITFSTRHFSFRLLGISHAAKTFPLPLPVITFCHHFFCCCCFSSFCCCSKVTNMPKTEREREQEREREREGGARNLPGAGNAT